MFVKPSGTGTDTPGAKAGSMQSISKETYTFLPIVSRIDFVTCTIPFSAISNGVITLRSYFFKLSSSSCSGVLTPICKLDLMSMCGNTS